MNFNIEISNIINRFYMSTCLIIAKNVLQYNNIDKCCFEKGYENHILKNNFDILKKINVKQDIVNKIMDTFVKLNFKLNQHEANKILQYINSY